MLEPTLKILIDEIYERIKQLEKDNLIDKSKKSILIKENKKFLVRCQQLHLSNLNFNHTRDISDFTDSLNKIREKGFNPIAVSQMMFEDVFVFETKEEALKAYSIFEKDNDFWIGDVVGFWYGKNDFIKQVKEYELKCNSKVLTHWIK